MSSRQVKDRIKSLAPNLYHKLWRWKEGGELPTNFGPYYDGVAPSNSMIATPEPCLLQLKLPAHIDTILDVGCASGRNFIPFDGKLKLWGVDIVPGARIKWLRQFKNLKYEFLTLEKFTQRLEREPVDMRHTLVFAHGTLAYCSGEWQRRFYGICMVNGAKNFIFTEYPPQERYPNKNFKLPQDQFTARKFREPTLATTFYRLEE